MFTYSGNPAYSSRDAVRLLIGDTVDTKAVFQDEELDWFLTQNTNIYFAAALAADAAAARFSGSESSGSVKTKTVGSLSISYADTERIAEYRTLGRELRYRGAINASWQPYAGGISISDKKTNEQDTDWDRGAFARGMHDYPGSDLPPSQYLSTST